MAVDVTEPVWREDIEMEIEYMGEGTRTLHAFFVKAQAQGAPQELLNEIWYSYQYALEARRRLEAIRDCFVPEPVRGS
jgi:hypothetical protein